MTYLQHCWYIAAWDAEIAEGAMVSRRICDLPILLFRDAAEPRALLDSCPHRFAPLGKGVLEDGVVTCGYHGLAFDGSGSCVRNPHGPITRAMQVRSFPVVERHHALWIWIGAPDNADPALIPDMAFMDVDEPGAYSVGHLAVAANYQLYVDNIMDLSHIDFLHANSLGGGAITAARQVVAEGERWLKKRWTIDGVIATPLEIALRNVRQDQLIDRYTEVEWHPAGTMSLTAAILPQGAPETDRAINFSVHSMTPETETTMHYFFGSARNYLVDDMEFNERFSRARDLVFSTEDGPMIAGVQDRMGSAIDLLAMRPILLKTDEAAVRVRRKLGAMIAAEQEEMAEASLS